MNWSVHPACGRTVFWREKAVAKDWLEMKYHPAMKEIEFRRGSGNNTTLVDKKSVL